MNAPNINILYVVNARIPTGRAHSLQITQTATALGSFCRSVTLVTPFFADAESFETLSNVNLKRLPALDVPYMVRWRFYLRSITYAPSLCVYLIFVWVRSLFSSEKVVLYVRGEVIFLLYPFFYLFPVFFETHQIRNHDRLYQFLLRRVRGVVVITERLKAKLIEEFGVSSEKIIVARDAVDIDRFMHVAQDETLYDTYKLPRDKKLVMYTGSLGVEKGVYTLADTATLLNKGVHLVIVGGLDFQLPAFREKYGTSNISIIGQVDHQEIPRLLSCADVVVLPDLASDTYSNLYTSPMKLFEYMASGKCIIAANVPSLREVLDEQSAYFFTSGDTQSLAETINHVVKDTIGCTQKSLRAAELVSQYTWSKRAENIVQFVGSLVT